MKEIRRLDFVGRQARIGCVDLRGGLYAAIAHILLKRLQSRFDAFHVSAILRGSLSHLLGDQMSCFLFVLKPPPKPDPKHREDRNPEDRHDQQRFLVGKDLDDAVLHINLLTCTDRGTQHGERRVHARTIDRMSFAHTSC